MWRITAVATVFILIGGGTWFYLDYTKTIPYEDLKGLVKAYNNSQLKERSSAIRIETSEDVKFVDLGDKFRVDYGIYPFYLYKDSMMDEEVRELMKRVQLEVKLKDDRIIPIYKGEELPIYLETGWLSGSVDS